MAKLAVAMVFLADHNQADSIITKIRQQFDIELLHIETSYSKLWIKRDDQQEENHDKN